VASEGQLVLWSLWQCRRQQVSARIAAAAAEAVAAAAAVFAGEYSLCIAFVFFFRCWLVADKQSKLSDS
jgi:hypothetical protein